MIKVKFQKKLDAFFGDMNLSIDHEFEMGKIYAIFGKSGSGKTSFLRMLAGLMNPEEGFLSVNGSLWLNTTKGVHTPIQKRKIGMVFQDYSLFPNMSVRRNLEFALPKDSNPRRIDELIRLMELQALEQKLPQTLSGGQQQRVALARAIVREPLLLLLDEPLSSLDSLLRQRLQYYIRKVHEEYGLTTFWVSHNSEEIEKVADEIICMHNGELIRGTEAVKRLPKPTVAQGTVTRLFERKGQTWAEITFGQSLLELPYDNIDLVVGQTIHLNREAAN